MKPEEKLDQILDGNLPRHVAIIPDGNGRWAHERGLERTEGHRKGTERAEDLIEFISRKLPIDYLTFFAFSTENWSRPQKEVRYLMTLLKNLLGERGEKLQKNDVRLIVIGNQEEIPSETAKVVSRTVENTKGNEGLSLILAINYGGRQEILQAARNLVTDAVEGSLTGDQLTEDLFSSKLFTAGIPDPDLLIRTSGERRISNFMLWQMAYTEIWITEKFWPSFEPDDFLDAISDFQQRDRRFGRVNEGKENS